jgi:hypothetical protein
VSFDDDGEASLEATINSESGQASELIAMKSVATPLIMVPLSAPRQQKHRQLSSAQVM